MLHQIYASNDITIIAFLQKKVNNINETGKLLKTYMDLLLEYRNFIVALATGIANNLAVIQMIKF